MHALSLFHLSCLFQGFFIAVPTNTENFKFLVHLLFFFFETECITYFKKQLNKYKEKLVILQLIEIIDIKIRKQG